MKPEKKKETASKLSHGMIVQCQKLNATIKRTQKRIIAHQILRLNCTQSIRKNNYAVIKILTDN